MSWPIQDLSDEHLSSASNSPALARTGILRMLRAVQAIIGARGTAGGVASLDPQGRVPAAESGRGVAGGVAGLGPSGTVPVAQLPLGGGGVAPLGSDSKIPIAHLPTTAPGGVATLAADGRIPAAQLAIPRVNWRASAPPTADMDESVGYSAGSIWHHDIGQVWICASAARGDAQWIPLNYARTHATLWSSSAGTGPGTITLSESLRNFEHVGVRAGGDSASLPSVVFASGVDMWTQQEGVRDAGALRYRYVSRTRIRILDSGGPSGKLYQVFGYGRYY